MELIAQQRQAFGKKTKALRRARLLPAVVFGKDVENLAVTVGAHDFAKVYAEAGETNLITLKVDTKDHNVLVKDVQYHPVTSSLLHVGFYEVDLTKKIRAEIPVEVIGEETNELIKSGEALPLVLINEITVEALPAELPNEFVVDVSGLVEVGAGITIAQLNYDRDKVEIIGHETDELVVKLDYALQEETEEAEVSEQEALEKLEATGEAKAEDEEVAAAGETATDAKE